MSNGLASVPELSGIFYDQTTGQPFSYDLNTGQVYDVSPTVAASDNPDIFGSVMGFLSKATDVGVSMFKTVTTLDTQKQIADTQLKATLADIDAKTRLAEAQNQADIAKLAYATRQYSVLPIVQPQAVSNSGTWLILGALGIGALFLLNR